MISYAVIMAGGRGTRFWPRSRERMPKHLLDITSERTILQETVARIEPLFPPERILIVTGESHAAELARQLPRIPGENILIEPMGRNTAPCIGLAAVAIRKRVGDAVMAVMPADHLIRDDDTYRRSLRAAAAFAEREQDLVTIGITPLAPETGYGYLERGALREEIEGEAIYACASMREKPDRESAVNYLATGRFFWNSGIFVWRASVILDALARWLPEIHKGLTEIEASLDTPQEVAVRERIYRAFPSVSIDYGVMEKEKKVALLAGRFDWSDVGSWDALWDVSPRDEAGNARRGAGPLIGLDARNNFVYSARKLVTLLDVEDLIVVETDDALLVCRRGKTQNIRRIVDTLQERHLEDYL